MVLDYASCDTTGITTGRFASTVAYYESARPPYGAAFFSALALELGLRPCPMSAPARAFWRLALSASRIVRAGLTGQADRRY
jgi:hypothetical protein